MWSPRCAASPVRRGLCGACHVQGDSADLVVTEAAVKQHLLRLYQKLRIAEGPNRRTRLANEIMALGLVRPLPVAEPAGPDAGPAGSASPRPAPAGRGAADSQLAS